MDSSAAIPSLGIGARGTLVVTLLADGEPVAGTVNVYSGALSARICSHNSDARGQVRFDLPGSAQYALDAVVPSGDPGTDPWSGTRTPLAGLVLPARTLTEVTFRFYRIQGRLLPAGKRRLQGVSVALTQPPHVLAERTYVGPSVHAVQVRPDGATGAFSLVVYPGEYRLEVTSAEGRVLLRRDVVIENHAIETTLRLPALRRLAQALRGHGAQAVPHPDRGEGR